MLDDMLWLFWVIDISWCLQIVVSFLVATPSHRTLKDISKSYIKGFFIIDVLATIPPMVAMQ